MMKEQSEKMLNLVRPYPLALRVVARSDRYISFEPLREYRMYKEALNASRSAVPDNNVWRANNCDSRFCRHRFLRQ